jgi:hypothetical protein
MQPAKVIQTPELIRPGAGTSAVKEQQMKFDPISEKEAEELSTNLWRDGEYDYEIREASEEISKAGNEMIKLELWIFDPSGGRRLLFDYLINGERTSWKIRHFASSCGLLSQYDKGLLMAPEIVGRTGRCTIGTQQAKDSFPAKNVVRGYVKGAASAANASPRPASARPSNRVKAPAGPDMDDEIPF